MDAPGFAYQMAKLYSCRKYVCPCDSIYTCEIVHRRVLTMSNEWVLVSGEILQDGPRVFDNYIGRSFLKKT